MGEFNNQKLLERAPENTGSQRRRAAQSAVTLLAAAGLISEALRLGCETYSNDLNPVAVLIQKCTLEYPQKIRPADPQNPYPANALARRRKTPGF